ncbi:uncharacterized protein VTP21DRAFT_2547 [Calcarisporiella thermophila]|uniref:uncharacterized protein n=1 Tax=Calcarisporiella thermophila TaxID=911321 RepID=UPI003742588C
MPCMKTLALLLFAAGASAAPYITSPITGTIFKAGEKALISWQNGSQGPTTIKLMFGDPHALQQVGVITATAEGSSGQYMWDVPSNLPDGNQYAIVMGSAPDISYSTPFSIKSASGAGAPQPAAAPEPPASPPLQAALASSSPSSVAQSPMPTVTATAKKSDAMSVAGVSMWSVGVILAGVLMGWN